MLGKPLRFVLLLDQRLVPAWQAQCIRELMNLNAATLVGVIKRRENLSAPRPGFYSRLKANRSKLLWRAFNRFYVDRFCQASKLQNISELLLGVPVHDDETVPVGRLSERISDGGMDFLAQARPDFILRFGFGILKGPVLNAAPLGVWSFHHGDPNRFRGQPPGFWEIFNGAETTGTVLQVLSEELDGGRVLQSGQFRTIFHSYAKTRDALYFGASDWVAKTCREYSLNGAIPEPPNVSSQKGPVFKEPDNKKMIFFLLKAIVSYWKMIRDYKLSRQAWIVGVIDAPIHEVAGLAGPEAKESALKRVTWLPVSSNQFNADPFGYSIDNTRKIRILYECYNWKTQLGEIHSVIYDGSHFYDRQTTLSATTHLSYPFVLAHEGKTFFIPEHSEARDVSAFEVGEDGVVLAKKTIFSRSEMVDATFFEWGGTFWAFAIEDNKTTNAELNIFHSESLWGPWHAHAQNPVKVNVSSARPAGTPFIYEGKLYRPAQDCGPNYGSAVVINLVGKLTTTEFEEFEITKISPSAGSIYDYGIHTLAGAGTYTLIDASRRESRFFHRAN